MRAIRLVRASVEGIPTGCTPGGVIPRFRVDPAPRRTVSLGFIACYAGKWVKPLASFFWPLPSRPNHLVVRANDGVALVHRPLY